MSDCFKNLVFSDSDGMETEQLIPISDEDDTEYKNEQEVILPILPIKYTVLFPGVVIPITVGRETSVKLIRKAYSDNAKTIGVVSQKNIGVDEPTEKDIYEIGTVAKIVKLLVLPDGNTTAIIQGRKKFEIEEVIKRKPYITAKVKLLPEVFPSAKQRETKALMESLKEAATKILKLNPEIPTEAQVALDNIDNPSFMTHFLSSNINVDVKEKQALLEINNGKDRATRLLQHMHKEIQLLEIKHEIQSKTHTDIDQQQRNYFLRQQMKILQSELGMESSDQEVEILLSKAKRKNWPQHAKEYFYKEISKLQRINPNAADYPVALNHCEFLIELPWNQTTKDNLDLHKVQKALDKDHYGLEKVKERILQYLAVLKLKNTIKGPILCLHGPPGVGKTSLGRSIANALNRKYARMSLGGLHDEAEIRGHRKTYIGAMPGRLLQNIKKSASSNPVFILDEIEKIGSDFRGDPSSALLEVLDPEQNSAFVDNYLEIPYDLSNVLFIATANSLETIHPALKDRMEIIEINGYTQEEKTAIAKRYLIPKQRRENGLTAKNIFFDEKSIKKITSEYTRESGVRNLERKITTVIRYTAKLVAMKEGYQKKVGKTQIENALGQPIYEQEIYETKEYAGVATGLAWTPVGGEILFIESSLSKGSGKLTLSGQLGDVMKESAMTAISYLKARSERFDINYKIFQKYDLHIHVPAGAIPKDGPSAGISILTAIVSTFTQRKIKTKLAMTGEITLRGKVLPVGGIKEKLLAAKRVGIKEVIFCEKNEKDIHEIEERYLKDLSIHFVKSAEEVLEIALLEEKINNPMQFDLSEETKQA